MGRAWQPGRGVAGTLHVRQLLLRLLRLLHHHLDLLLAVCWVGFPLLLSVRFTVLTLQLLLDILAVLLLDGGEIQNSLTDFLILVQLKVIYIPCNKKYLHYNHLLSCFQRSLSE